MLTARSLIRRGKLHLPGEELVTDKERSGEDSTNLLSEKSRKAFPFFVTVENFGSSLGKAFLFFYTHLLNIGLILAIFLLLDKKALIFLTGAHNTGIIDWRILSTILCIYSAPKSANRPGRGANPDQS